MSYVRAALASAAIGILLLAAGADSAEAHHSPHWTGVSDLDPPLSGDYRDTFVVKQWTLGGYGVPVKWCTNFNSNDKPALEQAINDWMAAFTSSFGNEFAEGSPCDLEFRWNTGNPCGNPAAWACYARSTADDLINRGGWYLTGGVIHFVGSRSWTYDRYRAIAAHELGHFHNMWEQ